MASKASKTLFVIKKLQYKFVNMSVTVLFMLYDGKIKPILLYGAEVKGFQERPVLENN